MKQPWFVVKRYGLGVSPSGWRGWLFMVGYILVVIPVGGLLLRMGGNTVDTLGFPALVLPFIIVVIVKSDGKPWRWRWGDDKR